MPIRVHPKLSDDVEREIIALYTSDNSVSVKDIQTTYGLDTASLYRLLNRHGIVRRTKAQRVTVRSEIVPALPSPTLAVTVDANGTVQSAERVARTDKLYVWEVRYESLTRLEASDIADAIAQIQQLPACRRVVQATLIGNRPKG